MAYHHELNPDWANIWFEVHPPPRLQPPWPLAGRANPPQLGIYGSRWSPPNHRGEWMIGKVVETLGKKR